MDALIFGRKIIAYPVVDWQATDREKLFTNYNAFSFPCLFCFSFIFPHSNTMSTPLKVKKNTWSIAEEKDFFVIM